MLSTGRFSRIRLYQTKVGALRSNSCAFKSSLGTSTDAPDMIRLYYEAFRFVQLPFESGEGQCHFFREGAHGITFFHYNRTVQENIRRWLGTLPVDCSFSLSGIATWLLMAKWLSIIKHICTENWKLLLERCPIIQSISKCKEEIIKQQLQIWLIGMCDNFYKKSFVYSYFISTTCTY